MKNIAIILASGSGQRTGLNTPKQFVKIAGKTILEHTVCTFENHKDIAEIIVVTREDSIELVNSILAKMNAKKVAKVLVGGATRKESSYIGINSIADDEANVLIHDAVRPFLTSKIINNCIEALKTHQAIDVAIPSSDTIVVVNENNFIKEIPQRKFFRRGQTPQCFYLPLIKKAHELALNDKTADGATDDCSLIIKYGLAPVYIIEGDEFNRKITYPLDVAIADKLFRLKTIKNETLDKTKLKDKVIVVFGATSGIGLETVEMAKSFGAKTYGFSRKLGVDIKNPHQVALALKEVYQKENRIDYVINTAGILKRGLLQEKSYCDIEEEILTNYLGSINVAKEAFNYLKETQGTLLFYTSSSYTRGRETYSIYSSSKAAIVNLAQALAQEWEEFKIKINIINPQRTKTPMRLESFGYEPPETLLCPKKVAEVSLDTLLADFTGQVIDVVKGV